MKILGIESTAHTFGVGIVEGTNLENAKVISNKKSMFKPPEGGIRPSEAAQHHTKKGPKVIKTALREADLKIEDIDAIAFARGPGIGSCLRIGSTLARYLSLKYNKPLYDVNHPVAHIEVARWATGAKDPVVIYVSGGNTQIISYAGEKYRVFGETQDISIGNALDSFARSAGLPFPGGPEIEKLAKDGNYIQLPYTVKGMDTSFSGMITKCKKMHKKGGKLEDICFSLQETAFSMLVEVTERALAHLEKDEVILTGGVAANKRLKEMIYTMCEERGAEFHPCPWEWCMDNGVMIAINGLLIANSNKDPIKMENSYFDDSWRADETDIHWMD